MIYSNTSQSAILAMERQRLGNYGDDFDDDYDNFDYDDDFDDEEDE